MDDDFDSQQRHNNSNVSGGKDDNNNGLFGFCKAVKKGAQKYYQQNGLDLKKNNWQSNVRMTIAMLISFEKIEIIMMTTMMMSKIQISHNNNKISKKKENRSIWSQ